MHMQTPKKNELFIHIHTCIYICIYIYIIFRLVTHDIPTNHTLRSQMVHESYFRFPKSWGYIHFNHPKSIFGFSMTKKPKNFGIPHDLENPHGPQKQPRCRSKRMTSSSQPTASARGQISRGCRGWDVQRVWDFDSGNRMGYHGVNTDV